MSIVLSTRPQLTQIYLLNKMGKTNEILKKIYIFVGFQKVDGIVGSLIIREPTNENVLQKFYDFDLPSHTILVQDWMHTSANDRFPGFLTKNTGQSPDSYLINGRGIYMVCKK